MGNKKKIVHLSMDDVAWILKYITESRFASIYDTTFFHKLRVWHERYGIIITLYCFTAFEGWSIAEFAGTAEFQRNRDWLKFGYHSNADTPFAGEDDYIAGWQLAEKTFKRLKCGRTDTLRLHCWNARDEQERFLQKQGVRHIICQDECVRCESLDSVTPESLRIGDDKVFFFTHEWCFDEQSDMFESAIKLYKEAGYDFV